MHLSSPQALWLALTIPSILALYILRPRQMQKIVPSALLWRQITVPQQAARPWQRLRPQLLLWLQLLAAALFSLGAAAPVWYLNKPSPATIVLLDTSASMQAVDSGETRFSRAIAEIEALALGLEKGARLTVIAFDRQPRVIIKDSNNYNEIKRALKNLKPSFCSADPEPAFSLVRALAREQNQPRLICLTDGGLTGLKNEQGAPELRLVGSREAANLAIASLSLRQAGTGQAALAVLVNYSARPASGKIQFSVGYQHQNEKTFQLEPGQASSFLWPDLPPGVPVAAQLEADDSRMDHFPLDNQAWAVPGEKRKRKILLVTEGNIFLEKIFNTLPALEIYKVTPGRYPSLLAGNYAYDLTILDGVAQPLPPGAVFLLNPPPGEIAGGLVVREEFRPGELAPEQDSPFLEYVELSQTHVAAARALELKSNWREDFAAGGKVIMAHGTAPERRMAVLSFALSNSDLPLRPAFPVLMLNVLSWLLPSELEVPDRVTPGEEVKINALPRAQKITVEDPDGVVTGLAPPFPPPPWIPEKPGLFRLTQTVRADNQNVSRVSRLVAVNGYSEQESDIALKDISPGEAKIPPPSAPAPRSLPLTGGLTLLALLVALLEWGVAGRGH